MCGGEGREKTRERERERDGESETDRQVREGFVLFACAGLPWGPAPLGEPRAQKITLNIFAKR